MRQLNDIGHERDTMSTVMKLTSAFEGIASMHISQIKDQVLSSQAFFGQLWQIYSQIRVDESFHFGRSQSGIKPMDKELIIVVTAEGSFSGDVDQKVMSAVLDYYKPDLQEIIVIGRHGAVQLAQRNIKYVRDFKLPQSDRNINVLPLIEEVQKYASTTAFYPTYISLMSQDVRHIKLSTEVGEWGKNVAKSNEMISESNYIFEPSVKAVVGHLESSMLQIMLSEIILESKLAQYASRFQAMHVARDKADESYSGLATLYNQAKRHYKDERLKEVISGLRKATT